MRWEIRLAIALPRVRRTDRRTLAHAIAELQIAEGMAIHAFRDRCILHLVHAAALRRLNTPLVPRRFLRDPEWMHRHVEAPGVRIQARVEDRWREEA